MEACLEDIASEECSNLSGLPEEETADMKCSRPGDIGALILMLGAPLVLCVLGCTSLYGLFNACNKFRLTNQIKTFSSEFNGNSGASAAAVPPPVAVPMYGAPAAGAVPPPTTAVYSTSTNFTTTGTVVANTMPYATPAPANAGPTLML